MTRETYLLHVSGWTCEGRGERNRVYWTHPAFGRACQREAILRQCKYDAAKRESDREDAAEALRFHRRLRYDQNRIWDWNRPREPRSPIPSTWPALEAAMRKWVTPGFVVFGSIRY